MSLLIELATLETIGVNENTDDDDDDDDPFDEDPFVLFVLPIGLVLGECGKRI